jgi:potassium efflux system protein
LLVAAVIGNLVGAFRMAEFFTLAPLKIFIAAVAIFITTKVAGAVVYLILISQALHRLHVISDDFQVIYRKVTRVVNLVLWLIFISDALRIFRVRDAVFDWGRSLLSTGRNIGELDITLASVLIFIFVIWLSIVISRIITRILEKDVFVRVSMAKGVPNSINMLLRVVLITIGFFIAAAAAGMKLTNLSIILGAFSVGIGFGLQNIFNNMVSGLILAFERPIKVGDTVQVGELMGTVLSIGLRSSIVRSFDGAEVIVPNGNLISNQMINWTRSDTNRRMDIRVGVAYGTDPEKVLAILEQVANEHKMVDKKLTPRAFFVGFGESSLDFRLLAWTDIEHRLMVESEMNVAINRNLANAGIEIPFPQRDLHIRSDDTKENR